MSVITVNFPNNFKKESVNMDENQIENLIERIDLEVECMEEYSLYNEDAREFITSFYYGEADTDEIIPKVIELINEIDFLDDNTEFSSTVKAKLIKEVKDLRLDPDTLFNALESHTDTDLANNYRSNDNTLLYQNLGEIEVPLSDSLVDELNELNSTDLEKVKDGIDAYMSGSDFVCTNLNGYGYCLDLDVESFCLAYIEGRITLK